MSDYMARYHSWREQQVCIGCDRPSCTMGPGEDKWVTEYLCTPCWGSGVRGEPPVMFDGYSGTTYRTKP